MIVGTQTKPDSTTLDFTKLLEYLNVIIKERSCEGNAIMTTFFLFYPNHDGWSASKVNIYVAPFSLFQLHQVLFNNQFSLDDHNYKLGNSLK
jgi:hypothetical protein